MHADNMPSGRATERHLKGLRMHAKAIQTRQGQAWDQIARAAYGAESLLHAVISANADEADVVLLSGNVRLSVPEVDTGTRQQATALLPPWERL